MKKTIQILKNLIQKILTELFFNRYLNALKSGSVAIDCGANVGEISYKMARTGAKVYAFEPNPFAFERLVSRTKAFSNVECINKGVWDRNTKTSLYFHQQAKNDDAFWSFGSSIMKNKGNVDQSRSVEVELIDLTEFIEKLGKPVDLLKIDIEGGEYDVVGDITVLAGRIGQLLVEFHHCYRSVPLSRTVDAVNRLRAAGFRIFHISPRTYEISFVRLP